jgi:opacity protein-like surface antigen
MRNPSIAAAALLACGLSAASLVLTASQASAADYPVLRGSQIEDAPPPPSSEYFNERFSWSGFYAGGFTGMSRTKFTPSDSTLQTQTNGLLTALSRSQGYTVTPTPTYADQADSGVSFGGFVGYNFLFGDVVLGVEADYTQQDARYASANPVRVNGVGVNNVAATLRGGHKLTDYGSARVRFGYAWGRLMPYATLGVAVGRGDNEVSLTDPAAQLAGVPALVRTRDSYLYGATIGLGLEAALADNIVVRGEYLLTRFSSFEGTVIDINNARVGAALKF